MPRYIDADEFKQRLADRDIFFPALYKNELNSTPTADVVPREECEKWYHEYHVMKQYFLQECKYHSETARLADYYEELYRNTAEAGESNVRLVTILKHVAVHGYEMRIASFRGTSIPEIKITNKHVPNKEGTVVVNKKDARQIMHEIGKIFEMFEGCRMSTMPEGEIEDAENS